MRIALLAAAVLLVAAPAVAQDKPAANTTIAAMIAKGVTISVGGMDHDIAYKPDGTFDGGQFQGKYKVDGDKICLTIEGLADNQCTAYPNGKKSGDSFEVESGFGPMTIKIK